MTKIIEMIEATNHNPISINQPSINHEEHLNIIANTINAFHTFIDESIFDMKNKQESTVIKAYDININSNSTTIYLLCHENRLYFTNKIILNIILSMFKLIDWDLEPSIGPFKGN